MALSFLVLTIVFPMAVALAHLAGGQAVLTVITTEAAIVEAPKKVLSV
ncbi:MAG TPA: hypothetical protein VII63_00060 [Caulobacteraceae bacterium]